jgi:hypothetical protein
MKKKLVLFAGIYHTGKRKYVELRQRVVSPGGIYTGKKAGNSGGNQGNAASGPVGNGLIRGPSIFPGLVILPAGIFSMAANSACSP